MSVSAECLLDIAERPDNAPWRDASHVVLAGKLSCERVAIGPGRATDNAAVVPLACPAGGDCHGLVSVIGPSTENTTRSSSITIRKNGRVGSPSSIASAYAMCRAFNGGGPGGPVAEGRGLSSAAWGFVLIRTRPVLDTFGHYHVTRGHQDHLVPDACVLNRVGNGESLSGHLRHSVAWYKSCDCPYLEANSRAFPPRTAQKSPAVRGAGQVRGECRGWCPAQ